MTDEFTDIAPYSDEQTVAALRSLASDPRCLAISKYLMPRQPATTLGSILRSVESVDDFQDKVMVGAVNTVLERSTSGLAVDGLENLPKAGPDGRIPCFLAISNHRDIVVDPAVIQYALKCNGLPYIDFCVGDNLLSNSVAATLLRCNRMIKVIRGISARELYLSSRILSSYIRKTITEGTSSVWIAQREGRTKNGYDYTEQGLLKMFDMSGEGDFEANFKELHIIPISISYEYEPCDIRKAREVFISRSEKYVKKRNEDLHSILTGIRQYKGGVHLHFGEPLSDAEIAEAACGNKNDRYQSLRSVLDRRIISGYKLWKTNYMAYDILHGCTRFVDKYTQKELSSFKDYIDHKMRKIGRTLSRDGVLEVFLQIYAGPVESALDPQDGTVI